MKEVVLYKYRVEGSSAASSWIDVDADKYEITAAGGLLVFFKDGDEVAVIRHWNEVIKTENLKF